MVLLRRVIGETLRTRRRAQRRTLRDVSASANVSLGYLSEIERGQKEASSELLSSICEALEVPLSDVLDDVTNEVARAEDAVASLDVRPHLEPAPAMGPVAVLRKVSRIDAHRRQDSPDSGQNPAPPVPEIDRPLPAPVSLADARARREHARRSAPQVTAGVLERKLVA